MLPYDSSVFPFFFPPDQNPVASHSSEISRSWQVSERGIWNRELLVPPFSDPRLEKDAYCLPLYYLIVYLKAEKQVVNFSPSCLAEVNMLHFASHVALQMGISEMEEEGPAIGQN